ncbi:MAG TPA: hypothetical protein DDX71_05600 [Ruminococcus sp.]|nr:hypothetical protein [Ruminococcus sp.]
MTTDPKRPEADADELVALLDSLVASGTQHINLEIGAETRVQTVNSSACDPRKGPCAAPNYEQEDAEPLREASGADDF